MSLIDFAAAGVRHAKPGYIAERQTITTHGILALTPRESDADAPKAENASAPGKSKPHLSPTEARYQLLRNIERHAPPRDALKWQAARILRDDGIFGRFRFGNSVLQLRRAETGRILKAAAQQPALMKAADPGRRLRDALDPAPKPAARRCYAVLEQKPGIRPGIMPNASLSLKQIVPEVLARAAKQMLPPGAAMALKLASGAMRPMPATRRRLLSYEK